MKIVIGNRRSGKTTLCYKTLEENPNAIMFTLTTALADAAPKHLRRRVYSINSSLYKYAGLNFKPVIIDEADFVSNQRLLNMIDENDIILVASSVYKSYTCPDTWLRRMIMKYGYTKIASKNTDLYVAMLTESLSQSVIDRELFSLFRDLYRSARL